MSDKITIECPMCKRTGKTPGHRSDPKGTHRVQIVCPKCDNGGWGEDKYFDKDGKELFVP